ncbi:redoxin domain-containing protein [Spiribacter sp. 2438]|uniref:TlpA family protein disulfide reductase n=1 Tax=Spiribacter sp. 2438 TaxID=2666185 RepID=UPI0012AF9008|nr:TlpA disulfide reductase family protein [Spiribacter sp. 2438]QGM20929.1 redoxin domain-containing protein [Spiribacter sp. 2438]
MSSGVRTAVTILLAAVIGAASGILAVYWFQQGGEPDAPPRPAFTLPDLDGERRSISEWDDHIVVLNFWATWCAPCREEIPLFTRLHEEFADRDVRFLGVAIDDPEPIRTFLGEVRMGYTTLYGMETALDVTAAYGNERGTLPYTVIISRDGRILQRFSGQLHEEDLRPVLLDLTSSAN